MKRKWLEGHFLAAVAVSTAFAQGPPINTNTAFVVGLEGAAIRTFGTVMTKSTLFAGRQTADNPLDQVVTVSAVPVIVPYEVIPNRLVVTGAIPFLKKQMRWTEDGNRRSRGDSGLGDLKLLGKYQFIQKDTRSSSVRMTVLTGVEVPTGRTGATDAFGVLPAPLQLGSGSVDFIGGPIVTFVHDRLGVNGEVIFKKNTEANDYRFGDAASLNIALGYRIFPWIYETYPSPYSTVYLELLSQLTGRDTNKGQKVEDTGGKAILLAPGVQYVFSRTFLIEASFQVPLFQEVRGTQLGVDFSSSVGIRWLIL